MANIDIFGTLTNATGAPIVNANQVGSGINASEGELMQDTINSNLMAGKIYKEGAWVSNTSELTEATTTDLGGIKVANVRKDVSVDPEFGGSAAIDRNYGVELDQRGKAFVHVPWEDKITPIAGKNQLGSVKEEDNTGIVIDLNGVIKADFDTEDYSKVEDITKYDFSKTTAKVASPYVVNKILQKAIYEVLNTDY